MNDSTSSSQHQDGNENEQNHSVSAIDQIAHTEEVMKKDTEVDLRNKDTLAIKSTPEKFQ